MNKNKMKNEETGERLDKIEGRLKVIETTLDDVEDVVNNIYTLLVALNEKTIERL